MNDTTKLDVKFTAGLLPINEREERNGKTVTVHKQNVAYGIPTLADVNDGLPAPDSWVEVILPDGTKTTEPHYEDEYLDWVMSTILQRTRSVAAGRVKQGNKAATCWRDLLETNTGPKFMSLVKEARALFSGFLDESTTLSASGVEQLSSSYFGGATLKAAKPEIKEKVAGYIEAFNDSLDEETSATYAKVIDMVNNDINFDATEVDF